MLVVFRSLTLLLANLTKLATTAVLHRKSRFLRSIVGSMEETCASRYRSTIYLIERVAVHSDFEEHRNLVQISFSTNPWARCDRWFSIEATPRKMVICYSLRTSPRQEFCACNCDLVDSKSHIAPGVDAVNLFGSYRAKPFQRRSGQGPKLGGPKMSLQGMRGNSLPVSLPSGTILVVLSQLSRSLLEDSISGSRAVTSHAPSGRPNAVSC